MPSSTDQAEARRTLEFSSYSNERHAPPYGILSHRWQADEVTYQDMQSGTARNKEGFVKLFKFCEQCKDDGYHFAWLDTCCIDKSSSAELSEAINSMYKWYAAAAKCYAYLFDIDKTTDDTFVHSEWFRRGWTLQELIAPPNVHFYDKEWQHYGNKGQYSREISARSKIPIGVLCGRHPANYSIDQRLSWANGRVTTRDEDMAYSLLGLFDIFMQPQYGERMGAFHRLQEEIRRSSPDLAKFEINWIMPRPQCEDKGNQTDLPEATAREVNPRRDDNEMLHMSVKQDIQPGEITEPVRWQILRPLGRGTYADVDEVREISTGATYARKMITKRLAGMRESAIEQRVRKEVEVMKKLRHNHVANIQMLFQDEESWNIIMLPVADCDLRHFLEELFFANKFTR